MEKVNHSRAVEEIGVESTIKPRPKHVRQLRRGQVRGCDRGVVFEKRLELFGGHSMATAGNERQ